MEAYIAELEAKIKQLQDEIELKDKRIEQLTNDPNYEYARNEGYLEGFMNGKYSKENIEDGSQR